MVGVGTVGVHSSLLLFALEGYQACLLRAAPTHPHKTAQEHGALLTPTRVLWVKFARIQLAAIKIAGRLLNANDVVGSWEYNSQLALPNYARIKNPVCAISLPSRFIPHKRKV